MADTDVIEITTTTGEVVKIAQNSTYPTPPKYVLKGGVIMLYLNDRPIEIWIKGEDDIFRLDAGSNFM